MIEKLVNFKGAPQELGLPSAPKQFIQYLEDDNRPQVALDVDYENGMGVSVGRLREDTVYDWKFVGLSHNTVRGAAGGAILCAELLKAQGYITKNKESIVVFERSRKCGFFFGYRKFCSGKNFCNKILNQAVFYGIIGMKIISFPFWENIVNNGEQVEGDFFYEGKKDFSMDHCSITLHYKQRTGVCSRKYRNGREHHTGSSGRRFHKRKKRMRSLQRSVFLRTYRRK